MNSKQLRSRANGQGQVDGNGHNGSNGNNGHQSTYSSTSTLPTKSTKKRHRAQSTQPTQSTQKVVLSVVIPALNEKDGIKQTIQAIPKDQLEDMGYEVQILVVDNASDDGTGKLARKAGAEVVFEPKRGYGSAFKAGFNHARGDIIVTADADATYPVEDIPRLVNILEERNLEFLTTDRFALMNNGVMSRRNKAGNAILTLTMKTLFRVNIKDSQSGMWVFRKGLLDKLVLKSNTPLSQELKIEACHFAKCRWAEIPIEYRYRSGKAKLGGWKVGAGNLLDLLRKRVIR